MLRDYFARPLWNGCTCLLDVARVRCQRSDAPEVCCAVLRSPSDRISHDHAWAMAMAMAHLAVSLFSVCRSSAVGARDIAKMYALQRTSAHTCHITHIRPTSTVRYTRPELSSHLGLQYHHGLARRRARPHTSLLSGCRLLGGASCPSSASRVGKLGETTSLPSTATVSPTLATREMV